jgi:hypothetical protein
MKSTRKICKWLIGFSVLVIILIFCACLFFRISSLRDFDAYLGMASECHPVWKQFAFHHFESGDSVTNLLDKFPPSRREEFGQYGIYTYFQKPGGLSFSGLTVVSRDEKLIAVTAWSDTWLHSFFKTADTNLDLEYAAYRKTFHKKAEHQRLAKLTIALQKFYLEQQRWPTNEDEFSIFAAPGTPHDSTNDLAITLTPKANGNIEIGLLEFQDEKEIVKQPAQK